MNTTTTPPSAEKLAEIRADVMKFPVGRELDLVAIDRDELEELRKDKQRLDWLQEQGNRMFGWVADWSQQMEATFRLRQSTASACYSARAAIDSAHQTKSP
jgi:hypothetical protein